MQRAEQQVRELPIAEIETQLRRYCEAYVALRCGEREQIELHRLDRDRVQTFGINNLAALDQLIDWCAIALGRRGAAAPRPRRWA